jgi:hypothetical protein
MTIELDYRRDHWSESRRWIGALALASTCVGTVAFVEQIARTRRTWITFFIQPAQV